MSLIDLDALLLPALLLVLVFALVALPLAAGVIGYAMGRRARWADEVHGLERAAPIAGRPRASAADGALTWTPGSVSGPADATTLAFAAQVAAAAAERRPERADVASPRPAVAAAQAVARAKAVDAAPDPMPPSGAVFRPDAAPIADVLLVDDSVVVRTKMRRLFEDGGYSVHTASDGVKALALMDRGRYRLLVTDLEMPHMDGVTLIGHCQRRPDAAGMPILAVSGHEGLRATFDACRSVAGVHRKPWADDILLGHVAALIGVRSAPAKAASVPAENAA